MGTEEIADLQQELSNTRDEVRLLKQKIVQQDDVIVNLHKRNGEYLQALTEIKAVIVDSHSRRKQQLLLILEKAMNTHSASLESLVPVQSTAATQPQLHEQLIMTIKQLQLLLTEYHAMPADTQKEIRHQVYTHNGKYGHLIFKEIPAKASVASSFLAADNELIAKGKQ